MQLKIRSALITDIGEIQKIYAYYVLNGFASFEIDPPEKLEILERLELIKNRGHPYLVAETKGMVVGYAYATNFRDRPAYDHTLENSVYVSPVHLEKGIGFHLLESLIKDCVKGGYRQMIAVIGDSENSPSINLHVKCGFEHVGVLPSTGFKLGKWVDTVLMQRHLGDGAKTSPK